MNIVRLNEKNYFGVMAEAEKTLRSGGLVITPTDTVYGIVARADQPPIIECIFTLKQRKETEALPIFVKDIPTARKYAYISDAKAKFLEKVWPGAVTVIFHHKEKLPTILTGGKDTLGIRIPDHPFLLDLLGRFEVPLAQTSANISGQPPAKNLEDLEKYFGSGSDNPDLVIDGGEIKNEPSAVISFIGSKPLILRTGIISKSDFDQMFRLMV